MKKSTKEIINVITIMVIAVGIASWADASNTTPAPKYTVVCKTSEINSMCDIINNDGVKVDNVDMGIATENDFFSKPENVKAWVEGKFDSK